MSDFVRATLPPRILMLVGVLMIALKVFFGVEFLADPMQTTLGGAVALVGVIWFILAARKARQ